jgi:hypothetical protein
MARGSRQRFAADATACEDVEARAARLGITPERVLQEYARIAFSDMSRIVGWDEAGKMQAKPSTGLSQDDAPAIAEIVASASTGNVYRFKLHDKKPVLDALARHLGLLPLKTGSHEEEQLDENEDPREFLIREVDRLAAEEAEGPGDPGVEQ